MDAGVMLRGLIIGFSIAAPVGPIGVLVIRRTLAEGPLAGLMTGLGAATADACYGSIAAFGLTVVSSLLLGLRLWVQLLGGLFLCYLGVRAILSAPAARPAQVAGGNLAGAYLATFALTLTNPTTILSFIAIFAGLGLGTGSSALDGAVLLVLGVFTGSALWWVLLSGGVNVLRRRLDTGALVWVNRISGLVILGFGVLALLSLLWASAVPA